MDHETIEGLIPAYALGATDPGESQAVENHLPGCAACRSLLAEYRVLSEDLSYAIPTLNAPVGMAERLRRRLEPPRPEPERESWWGRLRVRPAWLALGAALLLLAVTNLYWLGRVQGLTRQPAGPAASFAWLSNAASIPLRANATGGYVQGVVYAPTDGQIALLCVYGMPELTPDKTYQLWLIRDGVRDNGGLLRVSPDGFGLLVVRPERPLSEYSAVGITVEPAGGSPGPTSPRVLGGEL